MQPTPYLFLCLVCMYGICSCMDPVQGVFDREGLLKHVLSWKESLESVQPANHGDIWTPELGAWLSEVRLDGIILSPPVEPADHEKVCL